MVFWALADIAASPMTAVAMEDQDRAWNGNDMDGYADDLSELVEKLDLKNAIHVGHSTGGGEVAVISAVTAPSGWPRQC